MESKIISSIIESQYTKISDSKWTLQVEDDPLSDDLIIPLPAELMATLGWAVDDVIVWNIDEESGVCTISKKASE
jgi:hypothetical protein